MLTHPGPPERSAVDRMFSILDAFDHRNLTLTLSDISRRSRLPVATVHRIVNKLHSQVPSWALERTEDGKYRIGLRLWEIGSLAPRWSALRATALPHLVKLQSQIAASVLLAVRDRTDVVYLEVVCESPGVRPGVGSRLPPHVTASGLLLFAHTSAETQESVFSGPLRRYTDFTVTEPAELHGALEQARRQGYAVAHRSLCDRHSSVAAPIRDAHGLVIAAIKVTLDSSVLWRVMPAPPVARRRGSSLPVRGRRTPGAGGPYLTCLVSCFLW
ncbi:IclR family transcriptional regulator [Streptomyces canus]|uniref:IclR family transcriptional regulator n=1 Tax=Streptomyces canus TaxID=58343 RepID=UPI003820B974